jgi:hypothetical protein
MPFSAPAHAEKYNQTPTTTTCAHEQNTWEEIAATWGVQRHREGEGQQRGVRGEAAKRRQHGAGFGDTVRCITTLMLLLGGHGQRVGLVVLQAAAHLPNKA